MKVFNRVLVICSLASASRSDDLFEETVSTRLVFAGFENPSSFPVVDITRVAHSAALGTSTVALLALSSGGAWGLYSADTAVVGVESFQSLDLSPALPLDGACITKGTSAGHIFAVVPSVGVFRIDCEKGADKCATTNIADASSLTAVTACDSSGFGENSGGMVLAAASPQGLFAVAVETAAVVKSAGGNAHHRQSTSAFLGAKLVAVSIQGKHISPHQHDPRRAVKGRNKEEELVGGGGTIDAVPDGEEVVGVAVSAGWLPGGLAGLSLACSTYDHLYYGVSLDSPTAALLEEKKSLTSSSSLSLVWREEWASISEEPGDVSGGAVDWTPAKNGLVFEEKKIVTKAPSLSSSSSSPRLWIGSALGLQVLDLDLGTFRRFDGPSQGLPYENVTAVALGSPFAPTSTDTASRPRSSSSKTRRSVFGDSEIWLGTAMGVARKKAAAEWRYMYGARWLPSINGNVRLLTPAWSNPSTTSSSCVGGCSSACDVPSSGAVAVTVAGLAVLSPQCMTLAAKAEAFQNTVPLRHDRYGLISGAELTNGGGDLEDFTNSPGDNDGLFTSMYAVSQVLKASVLAREEASLDPSSPPSSALNASISEVQTRWAALKFLFDVTGRTGCPARSYAKYGEEPLGPVPGDDNARAWYNSSTYPGWIWKGDTSSDEIVGHVFMQAALGALVKTPPPPPSQRLDQELEPEMKMKTVQAGGGGSGLRGLPATSSSSSPFSQQVVTSSNNQVNFLDESLAPMRAEAVALINDLMTGIIEANYTLIDPGLGTPTTWGRWDPFDTNQNRVYSDGKGLNSVQILAFLRAAEALTGNSSYFGGAAYGLKEDYGYGLNAVNAKITTPGDVNFSDDELAMLPFYTHLVLVGGIDNDDGDDTTTDANTVTTSASYSPSSSSSFLSSSSSSAALQDPEVLCGLARLWEQGVAAERSSLWAAMHSAVHSTVTDYDGDVADGHDAAMVDSGGLALMWEECGGVTELGLLSGAIVDVNVDAQGSAAAAVGGGGNVSPNVASDASVALWSLQKWPLDQVEWAAGTEQRSDVLVGKRYSRFGTPQANKAKLLPPNERLQSRWNADPWDLTGVLTSPGGSSETDPGAFLLAYWMARFHGLIVAAEQEAV